MKKLIGSLLGLVLLACPVFADEDNKGVEAAEKICSNLYGNDNVTNCLKLVNEAKYFNTDAVTVCSQLYGGDKIVSCLTTIRDKTFTETGVRACKSMYGSEKIIECLKSSGKPYKEKEAKPIVKPFPDNGNDGEYLRANLRKVRELIRKGENERAEQIINTLLENVR